jgi:hypothetical protein
VLEHLDDAALFTAPADDRQFGIGVGLQDELKVSGTGSLGQMARNPVPRVLFHKEMRGNDATGPVCSPSTPSTSGGFFR